MQDAQGQCLALGHKMLLVSNETVWPHYGDTVWQALSAAGFEVHPCILKDGEKYKNQESIQEIYNYAVEHHLERSSTLVALGGGVIGDMTGFAAATWMRGISVIQVPTSLLAMVDASIGGKTGINLPQGKNLIGAFHQPRFVLIDPDTLTTLPVREFQTGMAEVIKYGVIWTAQLFNDLEDCEDIDAYCKLPPGLLSRILVQSCQAKVDVVTQDEKEAGLRAILNYGHTIGHAIENLTKYGCNHGEAVALGMIAAGKIAVECQFWSPDCAKRQDQLIAKVGLPAQLPADLNIAAVFEQLRMDKKVQDGQVRFVLPADIGRVTSTGIVIPSDVIQERARRDEGICLVGC